MDLVYVYKKVFGSNYELRFSLRSAEKNLKFDNVFIVGSKPSITNENITHIPIADNERDRHKNVGKKIKAIIEDDRISENFILMNDDFFILKEFDEIPYYYNRHLKQWVKKERAGGKFNSFKCRRWYYFINQVYERFPEGKFFELHFPIVYNKEKLKAVIDKYNLELTAMLRSHYCNEYEKELNIKESIDYKIYSVKMIKEMKDNTKFISTKNDMAQTTAFKSFISKRFPQKSSYEK